MNARAEVMVAALNNAEWCDIFCRSHGIVGAFDSHAWSSSRRTPPSYPDAVTLEPAVGGERILGLVDTTSPGCSVKDSFARLDLSPAGFRILFEAEWISRSPGPPVAACGPAIDWRPVLAARELQAWEAARSGGRTAVPRFLPSLLGHASVSVVGGYVAGSPVAGFVLNRTGAVVGVSNLFTTLGGGSDAWSGCLATVARISPGLRIVGYEAGAALAAAQEHGLLSIGPLRVWIKDS